jgi:competence protein ComEA
MINLDEQGQRRPVPGAMGAAAMGPAGAGGPAGGGAAGGGPRAAGPAVLFRQPPAQGSAAQGPGAMAGGPAGQAGPAAGLEPMQRFQMEQARLQELQGIIGQAQARLAAVRAAMGKQDANAGTGSQYAQALKGNGNGNR